MKIEIRSPIRVERTRNPEVVSLIDEVKAATEKDLKPKIAFMKRLKKRLGENLHDIASDLLNDEAKQ